MISKIARAGGHVWNAGSEAADPLNGALVVVGTNVNRVNENGVVRFDTTDFALFDGLETPAGYFFDGDTLTNEAQIHRISFEVMPEPASLAVLGLPGLRSPAAGGSAPLILILAQQPATPTAVFTR